MPALPTLPTFVNGPSDASQLLQLVAAINFLYHPPVAKINQSTAQSINNATSTAVQFNNPTDILDTDVDGTGGHDPVTNNTRFTARYPLWMWVAGSVTFAANATGIRTCWLAINGIDVDSSAESSPGTASDVLSISTRPTKIYLAQGDYVELMAYQTSGGALSTVVSPALYRPSLDIGLAAAA